MLLFVGRRTELTPEVEALILQSFRQGNSYRITAGLAGVNVDTLLGWLKQGKAERSPRLRKFYFDVRNVRALLDRASTESIKKGIMGGFFQVPVHDKEGHLIPEIDPVTGQIVRDQKGRSCFQMKTEYREPDAKLALRVLERLNRWEFGKTRGGVDLDWAELDQPASEEPEIDHHYYDKPLVQRVMDMLLAAKVEFPGYQIIPIDPPEKPPNSDAEANGDAAENKEKKS